MVQITALAQEIQDELNGNINAIALDLNFKIHASVGTYKKATLNANGTKTQYINGVLRSTTGNYVPVKSVNNLFTSLMLEFAVPQSKTEDVELILSSWMEALIGEIYTLGNWSLIITPQPATPGQAKNTSPMGATVPYLVVLNIQFIKDGLISNAVEWQIDGNDITPDQVGSTFNRTPDIKPMANDGTTKADNQYETETIVFVLPISFTTIIQTLLNDIAAHDISKTYTITRSDSFSTDRSGTYTMTNAELNEQAGKIVSMTLTFNPATA